LDFYKVLGRTMFTWCVARGACSQVTFCLDARWKVAGWRGQGGGNSPV
jgi:hypothetical protein